MCEFNFNLNTHFLIRYCVKCFVIEQKVGRNRMFQVDHASRIGCSKGREGGIVEKKTNCGHGGRIYEICEKGAV